MKDLEINLDTYITDLHKSRQALLEKLQKLQAKLQKIEKEIEDYEHRSVCTKQRRVRPDVSDDGKVDNNTKVQKRKL